MAETASEARAAIEAALADARSRADGPGIVDGLVRLASVEVALDRPGLALPLLREAMERVEAGEATPLLAAQVAYVRGLALARSGGDPLPSFRHAEAGFRAVERPVDWLRARQRVVQTLQERRLTREALAELEGMVTDLIALGSDRGLVDVHRHRAALYVLQADFDGAQRAYGEAVAAAERLGDEALRLRVRLERRAVVPFSNADAARWEDWRTLLRDARTLNDAAAAGEIQLQQAAAALAGDHFSEGLAFAAAARQAALDARQPVLYLMACLLIAEGREGQGDHAGVIEVLLTARATLGRAFGPELAEPVTQVLDSLEPRWGKAVFDQALAQYRAYASTRKAAEGQA